MASIVSEDQENDWDLIALSPSGIACDVILPVHVVILRKSAQPKQQQKEREREKKKKRFKMVFAPHNFKKKKKKKKEEYTLRSYFGLNMTKWTERSVRQLVTWFPFIPHFSAGFIGTVIKKHGKNIEATPPSQPRNS